MKTLLFSLPLFLICFACGSDRSYESQSASVESTSGSVGYDDEELVELDLDQSPQSPGVADGTDKTGPAKIIKSGSMAFEVSALDRAKAITDSLLIAQGGYYEKEQYRTEYGEVAYDLTLRVPSANFETLLAALEAGAGRLTTKSVSANDVTEEYVDLQIRLDSKLAYLQQYKDILKKARTIEEILEVQEKIRVIEEEIESKKGRLRFLDDRVGLSTLQLTLSEQTDRYVAEDPTFGSRIREALAGGGAAVVEVFIGLVYLWPFLLIGLVFFLLRGRIGRFFGRGKRGG